MASPPGISVIAPSFASLFSRSPAPRQNGGTVIFGLVNYPWESAHLRGRYDRLLSEVAGMFSDNHFCP